MQASGLSTKTTIRVIPASKKKAMNELKQEYNRIKESLIGPSVAAISPPSSWPVARERSRYSLGMGVSPPSWDFPSTAQQLYYREAE